MDGFEFIKKVKEIKLQVKVFFMSGLQLEDIRYRTELSLVGIDKPKACLVTGLDQDGEKAFYDTSKLFRICGSEIGFFDMLDWRRLSFDNVQS